MKLTRCGREIDRVKVHLPALRESVGCLVPQELDPEFDDKPPKGRAVRVPETFGLALTVGQWKINEFDERGGLGVGEFSRGNVEMFAIMARTICETLRLPIYVASVELGRRIKDAEDLGVLKIRVAQWEGIWDPVAIGAARCLLVPVCFDVGRAPRDWVLLVVRASPESASFATASSLCVRVFDRVGRTHQIDGLVRGLCAVLGTISSCAMQARSGRRDDFPRSVRPTTFLFVFLASCCAMCVWRRACLPWTTHRISS